MKRKSGFTLIELAVVISIIGILSAIMIGNFSGIQQKGRDQRRKSDLHAIQQALEIYYNDYHRYPETQQGVGNLASVGGVWINDNGSITPIPLGSKYIKTLPTDPKMTSGDPQSAVTNRNYAYYSGAGLGCLTAGQYYILYTNLEDANDSQANKPVAFVDKAGCSASWPPANVTSKQLYTVANP